MKLEDARNAYYDYSGTLSNINRQLALSGIAIVWFFIQPKNNAGFDFGAFKWAFIFFSAALFFDLVHYAVATASWGIYHRYKEKNIKPGAEFKAPKYINWIPICALVIKVVCTVTGYYLLIHNTALGNAF